MNRSFKPFFWLLTSFLCVGCAHTEPKGCDVEQQKTVLSPTPQVQAQVNPGGASGVEIPDTFHDFGVVEKGGDYVHEFRVKNGSSRVLHIKKVLPAWGTSVARFDREIPPGCEGTIVIRLNPEGCVGETTKTALVTTDDPQKSHFMLSVKGKPSR